MHTYWWFRFILFVLLFACHLYQITGEVKTSTWTRELGRKTSEITKSNNCTTNCWKCVILLLMTCVRMWPEVKCLLIYSIPFHRTQSGIYFILFFYHSFPQEQICLSTMNLRLRELHTIFFVLFSNLSIKLEKTWGRYLFSKTYVFFMIDRFNDLMIALFFHWEHVQNFSSGKYIAGVIWQTTKIFVYTLVRITEFYFFAHFIAKPLT